MQKKLRKHQTILVNDIFASWNAGAKVVAACTATGSGKTVVKAAIANMLQGTGIIQAHRAELVGQISTALGEQGLRHNIIASSTTVRAVVDTHMQELGHSMYDPRAAWSVASTDTILARGIPGADRIAYHFVDEGHHVLRANKWGRAMLMTPNARGLLMTATAGRPDGKGLGAHTDGLADTLVLGPGPGELIRDGLLCSYDVAAAKASDLDMSDVAEGTTGDYVQSHVVRAVKRSKKIVGDIVDNYRKYADGKQAILFAVDIEHAGIITTALQAAGIAAELVHGKTEETQRRGIVKKFKARTVQVLVNVDLFGEGFDVPGVEVVIMARPTASFTLFCQMIGRMLRLAVGEFHQSMWDTYDVATRLSVIAASPKPKALLIDHVGNVYQRWKVGDTEYAGLPEGFNGWTLNRRNKRASKPSDGIPMRRCIGDPAAADEKDRKGCSLEYERTLDACPYCGCAAPEPALRATPQQVEGDVLMLSPEVLAKMRGQVVNLSGIAPLPFGLPAEAVRAYQKRMAATQAAQHHLREAIAVWAGRQAGKSQAELSRLFWYTFGVDVISAVSLTTSDADALRNKVEGKT